ncbi:hypothetical protein E2542_SST10996 [Spatholobus suberectus]|nr:hypothetical protein E2542_SST10996 [Spatholobus suberectus]
MRRSSSSPVKRLRFAVAVFLLKLPYRHCHAATMLCYASDASALVFPGHSDIVSAPSWLRDGKNSRRNELSSFAITQFGTCDLDLLPPVYGSSAGVVEVIWNLGMEKHEGFTPSPSIRR